MECYRVLDRLRLAGTLDDHEIAERREIVDERLDGMETGALDRRILRRAAEPMPTTLGTLDAIHIATALALRVRRPTLCMATHDEPAIRRRSAPP